MTPTAKVVSLLKQNCDKLPGLKPEHIHAFMIKPNDWSKTDCVVRVNYLPVHMNMETLILFQCGVPYKSNFIIQQITPKTWA